MATAHYLVNGVGGNFVRKIIKEDPRALLIFDCEKMNYANALDIYQATKKLLV